MDFYTWTELKNEDKPENHTHRRWSKYDDIFIKFIMTIARKHNLDPFKLREAFNLASIKGEFYYGNLTIQCREKNQDSAIFLVTNDEYIVTQFSIKLESLKNAIPYPL